MFKNRFLIVLGLLSMLLVAMAVSRPLRNVQESRRPVMIPVTNADYFSDYFQRHTEQASNLQDMVIPRTGSSESLDYYQRHPELRVPGAIIVDTTGDFYLRHPEWTGSVQAAVPVTGVSESLDYFQRHPELNVSAGIQADMSDYFVRHPELRTSTESDDLSDYFLRH